ncbi:MAG: MFS transporter [Burkholderiaceae bacterium]
MAGAPRLRETRTLTIGLWSLAAAYFMLATGSLAVVGLVQPMASAWHSSPADVAMLVTVFAFTFALAAPLAQMLLGHWPRRRLIIAGLVLLAVGLAITAVAPDLTWGVLGRVLSGAGAAAVGPVASALGSDMVPPRRQPQALATVFSGMAFATVLGVPLTAWFGYLIGWRQVFAALALGALACAIAIALGVRSRAAGSRVRFHDLHNAISRASVTWGVITGFLQMAAGFATYALVAVYLREQYHAGPDAISAALLLFGVGGIVGNLLASRLGSRYRPSTLILMSLLGLLVSVVGLRALPPTLGSGIVTFGLWSVATMMFHTPQQGRLIGLAPLQRGLLLSLNSSTLYLGMSLGAYLSKLTYAWAGSAALPVTSAFLTLAAICALVLSRRAELAEAAPSTGTAAHASPP